jgi:predicted PurR-regulated permease PerM
MLSRIVAVVLLVVGIVGIVIAVGGAWVSYQAVDSLVEAVDSLGNAFEQTLAYTSEGLDAVSDTQVGAALGGRVDEINDTVAQTRVNVSNQFRTVRLGLLLVFLWFGLTQLVPLYIGADLIADGRLGSKLLSK